MGAGSQKPQLNFKLIPSGDCDATAILLSDGLRQQLKEATEAAQKYEIIGTAKASVGTVGQGVLDGADYVGCSAKQAGAAILDLNPAQLPPPIYSYLLNSVHSTMANKPEDFTPDAPQGYDKYSIPAGSLFGLIPLGGQMDLIVYTNGFTPAGGGISLTFSN